ncbi:MAG: hypothetical protein FWF94_00475 [Oscillospiraceae bacterium]|nr:hypothetical protein [Oscillospiraceae bacterium]
MKKILLMFIAVAIVVSIISFAIPSAETVSDYGNLGERIGVTFVDPNYTHTNESALIEGAKAVRKTGSKVLKLFLMHPKEKYGLPYNDEDVPNIIDVLKKTEFDIVFKMDFTTFILVVDMDTKDSSEWYNGFNEHEKETVIFNYYNAAKYLLEEYPEKTFIMQNWESELKMEIVLCDNKVTIPEEKERAYKGYIEYLEARHEGILKARNEIGNIKGNVYSAVELIWISKPFDFKLINFLNKHKLGDYISYSMASDLSVVGDNDRMQQFLQNIKTLKDKLNGQGFYIGEIGFSESEFGDFQNDTVMMYIKAAIDMGAAYSVIWQMYCNEYICNNCNDVINKSELIEKKETICKKCKYIVTVAQNNFRDRGLWLIRRDKSKTPLYHDVARTIEQNNFNTVITGDYFRNLGIITNGFIDGVGFTEGNIARGAVVKFTSDFIVPEGWVAWDGNLIKYVPAGKEVSLYIPDRIPSFIINPVVYPRVNPDLTCKSCGEYPCKCLPLETTTPIATTTPDITTTVPGVTTTTAPNTTMTAANITTVTDTNITSDAVATTAETVPHITSDTGEATVSSVSSAFSSSSTAATAPTTIIPTAPFPSTTATPPSAKFGILSSEGIAAGEPTIFCFIEILLDLVGLESKATNNSAAILSPQGKGAGKPTIFCGIEILQYLVGLTDGKQW